MSQMLKLLDKNFKAANLTVLNEAKEIIFVIMEKIGNLSTEIDNIKKTSMEILDWKIHI